MESRWRQQYSTIGQDFGRHRTRSAYRYWIPTATQWKVFKPNEVPLGSSQPKNIPCNRKMGECKRRAGAAGGRIDVSLGQDKWSLHAVSVNLGSPWWRSEHRWAVFEIFVWCYHLADGGWRALEWAVVWSACTNRSVCDWNKLASRGRQHV